MALYINELIKSVKSDILLENMINFFSNGLLALLTIIIFYGIWIVINKVLSKSFEIYKTDLTTSSFILMMIKYIILTIGLISALSKVGINTVSLMTSVGVLGLTLGFAAKDVLSNLISGIFIFWDRPFVLGDLVEIGDKYGEVKSITLRTTRIVTPDGKMLAIPNSNIVNTTVASYTNYPHLRLDIPVTISVYEDIEKSRKLLLEMLKHDNEILNDIPARIVVRELNDYNIKIELQVWIKNERAHIAKRFEIREKIFNTLRDNGVDMPFETLKIEPLNISHINKN
ncbi:MAG: mechanosensitive ion channel family protein [Candidatus Sericytochromatia bacterium]